MTPLRHDHGDAQDACRLASDEPRHCDALAYLITFHTYGTWLHGREEGSVDRCHNSPHLPQLPPDPLREESESTRLKSPPVKLDAAMRSAIEAAIREVCQHRGWRLLALNVRTNHVHAVVSGAATPERMMNDFKAYATRRLRERGLTQANAKVWSRHGSTRYLWDEETVADRCRYVLEGQGAGLD